MVCASCFDYNPNVVDELTNRISGASAAADVAAPVTIKIGLNTYTEQKSLADAVKNLVRNLNQFRGIDKFCQHIFFEKKNIKPGDMVRFTWHYTNRRVKGNHVSVFGVGDVHADPMNIEVIAIGRHDLRKSNVDKIVYTFADGWQTALDQQVHGTSFEFE